MFARTERLLLRPSWPEDASAIHQAVADEGIVRNLALVPWPYTQDDAAEFAALDHDFDYPNFMLMLRTNGAPKLIGSCGLARRDGAVELVARVGQVECRGAARDAARRAVGRS